MRRTKKSFTQRVMTGLAMGVLIVQNSLGSAAATEIDYPELNMVPRNSDRLESEAKVEGRRIWGVAIPMAASAAVTVAVGGVIWNSTDLAMAPAGWTAVGAGAIGLMISGAVVAFGSPYQAALTDLNAAYPKGTSVRERLTRERFAEEAVQRAARNGNRLRFLAATLQGVTNVYVFVSSFAYGRNFPNDMIVQSRSTMGMVAAGVGFLAAFAPVFFRPYWIDVAEEQDSFRKRIFSPVAQPAVFPVGDSLVPGVALAWKF